MLWRLSKLNIIVKSFQAFGHFLLLHLLKKNWALHSPLILISKGSSIVEVEHKSTREFLQKFMQLVFEILLVLSNQLFPQPSDRTQYSHYTMFNTISIEVKVWIYLNIIIHQRVTGTIFLRKCHSNHNSSIRLVIISSKTTAGLTFKFSKTPPEESSKKKVPRTHQPCRGWCWCSCSTDRSISRNNHLLGQIARVSSFAPYVHIFEPCMVFQ